MSDVEVAVVGGGPAGAALAIRLAQVGREVVLFERLPEPRWRAAGVYTSALTRRGLSALGLSGDQVARLIRPISAMAIRTADGQAACRLEYPAALNACGIDRVRLERVMLDRASQSGATVCEGASITAVDVDGQQAALQVHDDRGRRRLTTRLVVGADGPSSIVARSAGVILPNRRFRRAALTVHRADPSAAPADQPMEAEMIVGDGWYCGVAPVPAARVNLGLVIREADLRRELRRDGGLLGVLDRRLRGASRRERPWLDEPETDAVRVALPLLHRVNRAAGRNFLLIGDAAGFVDPLSGEGLHRALASADLAVSAIADWLDRRSGALDEYERRLRARFRGKDILSWMLQLFLAQPALAGQALRNLDRHAELRQAFALALADVVPASRVVNPLFLTRVLGPG